MGHLGEPEHPEVLATVRRAFEQIVGAGRVAGGTATESNLERQIELGARFLNTQWVPWAEAGGRAFLEKVAAASSR